MIQKKHLIRIVLLVLLVLSFALLSCTSNTVVITIENNIQLETQSIEGKTGDSVDFQIPEVVDSNFVGFYTDSDYTQFFGEEIISFPKKSLTLYAKYVPRALHKLSFDTEGGTAIKSYDVFEGEALDQYIPDAPVKNGYIFAGWATDKNVNIEESLFDFNSAMPDSSLVLYAQWQRDSSKSFYKFILHGSVYKEMALEKGEVLPLPETPKLDSGYVFDQWYTSTDGVGRPCFGEEIQFQPQLSNLDEDGAYCIYGNYYSKGLEIVDNTVVGYTGSAANIIIPWAKDGVLVSIIGENVFSGKKVRLVTFPQTIKDIEQNAFYGCNQLVSLVLPSQLESIGYQAFAFCILLEEVQIPKTAAVMIENAFYGCTALANIVVEEGNAQLMSYEGGVYSRDGKALVKCSPGLAEFVVKEGTTHIEENAFDSSALEKLIIPNSVVSIEKGAILAENSRLCELGLPAVANSHYLRDGEEVQIFNLAAVFGAEKYSDNMGSSIYFNSIYVPYTLEIVNISAIHAELSYSFYGCFHIKNINLPKEGLTYIGAGTFFVCYSLEEIIIPDTVTSISGGSILSAAFYYCYNLKKITLPFLQEGFLSFIFGASHYMDILNMGGLPTPYTFFLEEVYITATDHSEFASGAFYGNKNLKRIKTDSQIVKIGYETFYNCNALEEIDSLQYVEELACDNVQNLYSGAFAYCYSLKNFSLPSLCRGIIGTDAFLAVGAFCAPFDFQIGEGVEAIMDFAFMDCSTLGSITIPSTIVYIGMGSFFNCTGLKTLTIPSTVQAIAPSAFEGCNSLQFLEIPMQNNIDYIDENHETRTTFYLPIYFGATNVLGNKYKIGQADMHYVPRSLKTVSFNHCESGMQLSFSFYDCEFIESVSLFDGVISIGENAFYGCVSLKQITIPASVEIIEGGAFAYTTNLLEYKASESNSYFATTNGVLYSKDRQSLVSFPSGKKVASLVVLEGVRHIESFAFAGNKNVKEIVLPSTLESVGASILQNCTSLERIISNSQVFSVEHLNKGMLVGQEDEILYCYFGLETEVVLPESISGIASYVFSNLSFIQNITIGKNVKSIGKYAFLGISADIKFGEFSEIKIIGDSAFYGYLGQHLKLPDGINKLDASSFEGSGLVSMSLPSSISEIADYAFFNSSQLTTLIIPPSSQLKKIGIAAFAGCSLSSVEIPSHLEEIGDYAFAYNLIEAFDSIDTNLSKLGKYSFYANALQIIKISQKINTISEWAFACNSQLRDLVIEEGVVEIGDYAFSADTLLFGRENPLCVLDTINIPSSVERIGDSAFYGVGHYVVSSGEDGFYWYFTSEVSLTFAANSKLKSIGNNAFDMIRLNETLDLSQTMLEHIGDYAFANFITSNMYIDYYSMKRVIFPKTLLSIGEGAFFAQVGLQELVLPADIQEIGDFAFSLCQNLSTVIANVIIPPKIGETTFGTTVQFFVNDQSYDNYLTNKFWFIFAEQIKKISEIAG